MAPMQCRVAGSSVLAAALAAAACDFTGDSDGPGGTPPPPPIVVTSIETDPFVSYRSVPFTITGSGFNRSATSSGIPPPVTTGVVGPALPGTLAPQVIVTFRTTDGTPFADGTSAAAQVAVTVISDTEIQGNTPITNSPGIWASAVEVTDSIGSGTSATEIALFAGLTVFDVSAQEIAAAQPTPIEVFGLTFLPISGNATIRFTSVVPGAFPGPSDTLDVPGTVVDSSHVTGVTPALTLTTPIAAYVTIILDDEPGTPLAKSACALTVFEPTPPVPVVVSSITPPMPLSVPTQFTVTGTGFLGAGDPDVAVIFTATSGTPHFRGTALSVSVLGNATSDSMIVGTSPTGASPTDVTAFVTVVRADSVSATSATAIALFTAPVETVSTFTPNVFCPNVGAPFTITGANLPTPQTATVRFLAGNGTPFAGGTSATADVVATITSATQIDGPSPLAMSPVPFLAEVTVILQSSVELPMGVQCLFGLFPQCQPVPGGLVVTNLDDSGPGSLRDRINVAPPNGIITFQPGLAGTLNLDSSLVVTQSVEILGPGPEVIRISAQLNDYPVFRIENGASNTIIERLTISESAHNADGGGFLVRGGLTLTQCELADHTIVGRGAGVFVAVSGTLTMRECTLQGNSAEDRGAGVYVGDAATATLSGCTFNNNISGAGGAAVATTLLATFGAVNCTFHGNRATGGTGGGAIYVASTSTVNLLHCTLANNSAHNRGGGVLIDGTLFATNCIFSRNSDGRGDLEISNKGGTNNTAFSIVRVGTGSDLTNNVSGNLVGTPDNPIDAQLGELQANGGPTWTMALLANSPALNIADAGNSAPTDQRGVDRPQGPAPDRGALEATVNL